MTDHIYENSAEWASRAYPARDEFIEYTSYIDYPLPPASARQQSVHARPPQTYQDHLPRQVQRKGANSKKMSKYEALALLESLKTYIMVGGVVTFFVLSGLVATHPVGSSTNNSSSGPSFDPSQQQAPSDNGGGFFNQQGGGSQFGSGGGQPSSGTRTS